MQLEFCFTIHMRKKREGRGRILWICYNESVKNISWLKKVRCWSSISIVQTRLLWVFSTSNEGFVHIFYIIISMYFLASGTERQHPSVSALPLRQSIQMLPQVSNWYRSYRTKLKETVHIWQSLHASVNTGGGKNSTSHYVAIQCTQSSLR